MSEPTAEEIALARREAEHYADPRRFNEKHPTATLGRVFLHLLSRPQPSEPGAEALRAARAEAWDEGYACALYDGPDWSAPNPYRRVGGETDEKESDR